MEYDKKIEFGHSGGEYRQKLNVRKKNLPLNVDCNTEWLSARFDLPYVIITAEPNDGIGNRTGVVTIKDRFENTVAMEVDEDWFRDFRIECLDEINIPYTYYADHDSYDIYVTVYGGGKSFRSRGLTKVTEKVWDASQTYRDYIIHIPKATSGNYTLTHNDTEPYMQYCRDNGIEADIESVKHKILIRQVTEDDMSGEMVVSVDGSTYGYGNPAHVNCEYGKETIVSVDRCRYMRVAESGLAETVNEGNIVVSGVPTWLSCIASGNLVRIRPASPNPFANERRADIKLSSPSNPKLCTTITCVQASSSIKG